MKKLKFQEVLNMFKKIISTLLLVTLLCTPMTTIYATSLHNNNENVSPMANRYIYKTEYTYLARKKFSITEEEAKTTKKYDNAIRSVVGGIISGYLSGNFSYGVIVSYFLGEYYSSPYDAAGLYTVKLYKAEYLKIYLLTGKKTSIRNGCKLEIKHNNISSEKDFWY